MDKRQSSPGIKLTRILLLSVLVPATLFCWFAFAVTLIDARAGASPGNSLPLIDRFLMGLPSGVFGIVLSVLSICIFVWPRQPSRCDSRPHD